MISTTSPAPSVPLCVTTPLMPLRATPAAGDAEPGDASVALDRPASMTLLDLPSEMHSEIFKYMPLPDVEACAGALGYVPEGDSASLRLKIRAAAGIPDVLICLEELPRIDPAFRDQPVHDVFMRLKRRPEPGELVDEGQWRRLQDACVQASVGFSRPKAARVAKDRHAIELTRAMQSADGPDALGALLQQVPRLLRSDRAAALEDALKAIALVPAHSDVPERLAARYADLLVCCLSLAAKLPPEEKLRVIRACLIASRAEGWPRAGAWAVVQDHILSSARELPPPLLYRLVPQNAFFGYTFEKLIGPLEPEVRARVVDGLLDELALDDAPGQRVPRQIASLLRYLDPEDIPSRLERITHDLIERTPLAGRVQVLNELLFELIHSDLPGAAIPTAFGILLHNVARSGVNRGQVEFLLQSLQVMIVRADPEYREAMQGALDQVQKNAAGAPSEFVAWVQRKLLNLRPS